MNCRKCGSELFEGDAFCPNCGEPVKANIQAEKNIGGREEREQYYNNTQSKGINLVVLILIIVLVIALIGGIIFAIVKLTSKDTDNTNNVVNTNTVSDTSNTTVSNVNYPNGQVGNNVSFYKVKYNNFTLSIPDNMQYYLNTDCLSIANEEETWIAQLYITEGSFTNLKSRISSLQSYFIQEGFTVVKNTELKNINGQEVITTGLSKQQENGLLSYHRLNSMYVGASIIYTKTNELDYDVLNKISSIIASAKFEQESTNIKSNNKMNINMDILKNVLK